MVSLFSLKQKIRNILGLNSTPWKLIHPISYPFLSGDSFRSLADIIIETEDDLLILKHALRNIDVDFKTRVLIFTSVSFLEKDANKRAFLECVDSFSGNLFINSDLIIHNGDLIPDDLYYDELSRRFSTVYSVNIVKERANIKALPIGLENLHYLNNGLLNFFNEYRASKLFKINSHKKTLIFSSFNVGTNPLVRTKVKQDILESRFSSTFVKTTPDIYKKRISEAYFSISPPGNGWDCHRTWESIYLDTVPVVLANSIAASLSNDLPIFVVDNYRDFLSLSNDELTAIYYDITSKSTNLAYFDAWANIIKKNDQSKHYKL
jgi:hypothetical protein